MLKAGVPTQEPASEAGPNATKVVEPPFCPAPGEIAKHFRNWKSWNASVAVGMGMVYKARQPKLNRLLPSNSSLRERWRSKFAERFEREAKRWPGQSPEHCNGLRFRAG